MSKFFGWLKRNKKANKEEQNQAPITASEPVEQPSPSPITDTPQPEIDTNNLDVTPPAVAPEKSFSEAQPQADVAAPQTVAEAEPTSSSAPEAATTIEATETTEAKPASEPDMPQEKPSFFSRLKQGLKKTKENIGSGFANLFLGKKIDDELFEDLETQLLMADLGVETTTNIIDTLTESAKRDQLQDADKLYPVLKEQMAALLDPISEPLAIPVQSTPFVILMVGVNGVGKTTTIGKMAKQLQAQNKKVMLAAGDTFRAAAVEQLKVWGERNDIPVVAQETGSDSASVIFDAIQSAKARNVDVLIADTAGRLQNKDHLMEELKKIVRVMRKIDENAPHEIMLTIDAGTGQNAISQTKLFNDAVGLTGITLTKLDGTAKGGVIFALAEKYSVPVRFIGIGEGIDDLRAFDSRDFVDALFDTQKE